MNVDSQTCSTTSICFVILSAAFATLTGCASPSIQRTWPDPDPVIVVEMGQRRDLERVAIFWPRFPSGDRLEYVSEARPAANAAALRAFDRDCPQWRKLGWLTHYAVTPLREAFGEDYHRASVVLSIYPVVIGVIASPGPTGQERSPDLLVRPDDLSSDVQIVRLLHAQGFPSTSEVERALSGMKTNARAEAMSLLAELLVPQEITLERPLTIAESIQYIEEHSEFHQVRD